MKKCILILCFLLLLGTGLNASSKSPQPHQGASVDAQTLTSICIMNLNSSEEWVLIGEHDIIPLQNDIDIFDCDRSPIEHPLHLDFNEKKVRITYSLNMENAIHVQKVEVLCQ